MVRFSFRCSSFLVLIMLHLARLVSAFWKPGPAKMMIGGTAVAAGGLAIYLQQKQKNQQPLYTPEPMSLADQTILITGASTGLGLESAKRLAVGGANVILTARTDTKGKEAVNQVTDYLQQRGSGSTGTISYKVLDLDDLSSVRESVSSWTDIDKLDVLVNNAGIMALPKLERTVDGIEMQMQSNHLGHFLLTALLANNKKLSTNARIVNVSSEAHKFASAKGLDFEYLWKPTEAEYGPWKSYGQSKLANIFFTQELQRRVNQASGASSSGVDWTVVCLHPGGVATDLGKHLFGQENYQKLKLGKAGILQTALAKTIAFFIKTVEQGATTQVWLAARADEKEENVKVKGQYLSDCKVQTLGAFATNKEQATQLWKESEELTGIKFEFELVEAEQESEQEAATTAGSSSTA